MSKKYRFRKTLASQQVKRSQTHLKIMAGVLSSFFITLRGLHLKKALLVTFKILGVFVNIWTANDEYSLLTERIYRNQFKRNYLRNKNVFVNFFLHF